MGHLDGETGMRGISRWPRAAAVILFLALTALGAWPASGAALRLGQPAPELAGAAWINSRPLTTADLRGRVVLVEFWTYG
jgi:hypothetical protein